ncbi:hypothetical protein M501DRAFT_990038 [Patellaria atrata CBS 101060]|uniref:Maintenance of mitochondrial morphology protein 1 n=1 Tax=Patellaria atrata CBS 101060 TaxID=1346257 RepID=A0A9P4SFU2_9PEZI|nr:hypothetical protein M501DRAFT_990038 [Patellaria atrata CBS 101060]
MSKPQATPQQQPQAHGSSSLSFTQGFLLGQLSIALLIFAFIKFFIFGDPPPADERAARRSALRGSRTLSLSLSSHSRKPSSQSQLQRKRSQVLRNPAPLTTQSILAKTYYNVHGHQPESLDWFNVLVAQTIARLRTDALLDNAILTSLTNVLNGGAKPPWVGEIKVTEIALGEEFPIFSNCRVIPIEEGGPLSGGVPASGMSESTRLQAQMDVDLSDMITLGVETKLVLNYPSPFVAVLPVALAVSVVRFSGTLSLSFIPSSPPERPQSSHNKNRPPKEPAPPPHPPTALTFTFLPDYRLDLSVRSLLGSRARLQDVPKIASLVEDRLHAWFDARCVEPRFQQIVLPSLWPRKKNTRGGEGEDEDADAIGAGDVVGAGTGVGADQPAPGRETGAERRTKSESDRRERERERESETPHHGPDSMEARMIAEGAKLREAEIRAGERRDVEVRWRGSGLGPRQGQGEWRPGNMPGSLPDH